MNLRRIKFSDLAHITMGQSPKAETVNESGNGMPLLNGPSEFKNFNPVPVQFTTDAKKLSKESDILFCVRGSTTGRMNWSDQSYALGRGLAAITHKNGSHYNYFLKYLIEINLPSLLKGTSGSTFPNLTSDILSDFELPVPSTEIQSVLSKHLSIIDSKIELNNRINRELEAMAKLIYDYWFVQFEFPIEAASAAKMGDPSLEGKPYKSSGGKMVWNDVLKREIPEGWGAYSLNELVDCNSNSISKSSIPEIIQYLDTSNLTRNLIEGLQIIAKENLPSRAQRQVQKNDILFSTVRPNQRHYGIIKDPVKNMVASTGFAQLTSRVNWLGNDLLMLFLSSNPIVDRLQRIAESSVSAYPSISPNDLLALHIALPKHTSIVISTFNSLSNSTYLSISKKQKENLHLSSLRDWLLPMLMNGQVSVSAIASTDKSVSAQTLEHPKGLSRSLYKDLGDFDLDEAQNIAAEPEGEYGKRTKTTTISTTDAHAAVLTKIICIHEANPQHIDKLSHIKCEKITHLVEYHLGIDLGRNPVKDAAGPDDYHHLKKVESRAMKAGFFTVIKQELGYTYQSGRQAAAVIHKAEQALGHEHFANLNELIQKLLTFDMERAEVLATLYAGWNNLLLDGLNPSDEEIVWEARENWSKRKLKIKRENFFKTVEWMRRNNIIPKGTGKRVNAKLTSEKS